MRYGQIIDLNRCIGCAACVMACQTENGTPHKVYWNNMVFEETGVYPNAVRRHMPKACMHCQDAPCVNACPTGASYYDENGVVRVNHEECIGCSTCIAACPYDARHLNTVDPLVDSYWGEGFEATPNQVARADRNPIDKVSKCTLCAERVAEGDEPKCVQTCLTRARYFGDLDDPESEISKKMVELGAKAYLPELGTNPSVCYVGTCVS